MTRTEFHALAAQWKAETGFHSSVSIICSHPAYQAIIAAGQQVVPFILEDLRVNGPDHWFWALTEITGANPITADIAGYMQAMTDVWLEWGRANGHLP